MRGTRCPTITSFASSSHGAGSRDGSSAIVVSSRPSTSTFVETNRLGRGSDIVLTRLRRGEDGANDLRVGTAAAQIAAHRAPDVILVRHGRVVEECHGGEDLAGRAESALQRVVRDERGLQRMERLFRAYALDGRDRLVLARGRERETGIDG